MQKGNLSRAQAIEIVGAAAVDGVESKACEPTNRVGYNGSCQGDDLIEWSAGVSAEDKDGTPCTLVAYYYTTQDEVDAQGDDLGNVDWVIAGYEIV